MIDTDTQNESNDDFQFTCLDTQSVQSQFDFIKLPNNKGEDSRLEVIREEDTMGNFIKEDNFSTSMNRNRGGNQNLITSSNQKSANSSGFKMDKIKMISQEIDDIYEETQKSDTELKNSFQPSNIFMMQGPYNNMGKMNPPNFNFKQNMNYPQNNFVGNVNPMANNFAQNAYQMNPKLQLLHNQNPNPNNLKTKTKANINYAPNVSPHSNFNKPIDSEIVSGFRSQTEELIKKTLGVFESLKMNYCNFIDQYKNKFIHDSDLIKQVLVAETEFIIKEEEKNKLIDSRMECLFKEMMSLLNEFQRFN